MATLLPEGKQSFNNSAGAPLVGGKVYTYDAGTSTPRNTFQDAAGTVPNTNPVVLDARGEATIFWSGVYKVILKDVVDVAIWTVDNVASADGLANTLRSDLAASTGAGILGWIQLGVGAVFRWIQDKLRESVSVEDFGALGDWNGTTGTNNTTAIQAAINSVPGGGSIKLNLGNNKNYGLAGQITTSNRRVIFNGKGSILTLTANATSLIDIPGEDCEFSNVTVNKKTGVTGSAFTLGGNNHSLRRIRSLDQKWGTFFDCTNLKESHFSRIRVDLDVATRLGDIFKLNHCVNNTLSKSFLGYCAQMIFGTSVAHPVSGYYCEGFLVSDVVGVYAGKAVNFDNGTFIAVSNCVLDFCETQGVFVSNGHSNSVKNTWIASNLTNNFIGVGSVGTVANMQVHGCTFSRGAAAITGTFGVSLSGANAGVIGNAFIGGMNGGTVTHPTSQVIGNTLSGGGTNIVATATTASILGSLSVAVDLNVGGNATVSSIKSTTVSVAVPNGVTTIVYTFPNAAAAMFMVSANIGTQGLANNFGCFAIVKTDAASGSILQQTNSSLQNLTLTGLNLYCTQTSSVAQTCYVNVLKLL